MLCYSKKTLVVLVVLGLHGASTRLTAATNAPTKASSAELFDIKQEPNPGDWKSFLQAPQSVRQKLWQQQTTRGRQLRDWSWGWRIGWVRACAQGEAKKVMRSFCGQIFQAALTDKALVVRAEAATKLGQLFEGSGDDAATQLLVQAFQQPRNLRHGKPLYVQQRILFALSQIGGDVATSAAEKLASGHPMSLSYWRKLSAHKG